MGAIFGFVGEAVVSFATIVALPYMIADLVEKHREEQNNSENDKKKGPAAH